eukprot:11543897-Karenia_brevis.AAC.1
MRFGLLLGDTRVVAVGYADDLVLVCAGLSQAHGMVNGVKKALRRSGLELSDKITKNMVMRVAYERNSNRREEEDDDDIPLGEE